MAVALAGCVSGYVRAPEPAQWEPWRVGTAVVDAVPDRADGVGVADRALVGYQRRLRRPARDDAPGCQFSPSCSAYARQAIAAHGSWVGIAMTWSRLFLREPTAWAGDYQPVREGSRPCLYDPPR